MSKISLKPNASGTGNFSIEAPNSNVDRTLSLPDEAGTVLTNASDIESQVKTATNATGSAPVYACRAWVNFDGTGTVSIRDSGNVSSITDVNTGRYRVNFTNSMPDTNFCFVGSSIATGTATTFLSGDEPVQRGTGNTGDFFTETSGGTRTDSEDINVAIFR